VVSIVTIQADKQYFAVFNIYLKNTFKNQAVELNVQCYFLLKPSHLKRLTFKLSLETENIKKYDFKY